MLSYITVLSAFHLFSPGYALKTHLWSAGGCFPDPVAGKDGVFSRSARISSIGASGVDPQFCATTQEMTIFLLCYRIQQLIRVRSVQLVYGERPAMGGLLWNGGGVGIQLAVFIYLHCMASRRTCLLETYALPDRSQSYYLVLVWA